MTKRYDLTPEDPDRLLAERLAAGPLAPREGLRVEDDDLLRAIDIMRADYASAPALADPSGLWGRITEAIRPASEPARRTGLRLVFGRPAWATLLVAASVVFIALAVVLNRGTLGAQPVAESFAETAVYETPDGSMVTLRPHSRLWSDPDSESSFRLEGEGLFEVVKNSARVFTVEAGGARVEVLGTTFTVAEAAASVQVRLVEGRVRVSGAEPGRAVELAPGEGADWTNGGLTGPFATESDEVLDWTRGELVYRSRVASDVVAEVARHYAIDIVLPTGVASERLSGRVLLTDPAKVLEDLGVVLGGRFRESEPGVFRYES